MGYFIFRRWRLRGLSLVESPPESILSCVIMNFDRLAAHYHWMERVFAGGLMQRCRITFLPRAENCRRALLVGEGPGRFLARLLHRNPAVRVVCLEQSTGMIAQARLRLAREGLDSSRVQFQPIDVLEWTPPEAEFDLIVTNFFLDCFRADQLRQVVPRLAQSAAPGATWLLADFRLPERGWRRWRGVLILAALYAFFKLSTSLSASWLTPPDELLTASGFELVERRLASFGLAHSDCWRRKNS